MYARSGSSAKAYRSESTSGFLAGRGVLGRSARETRAKRCCHWTVGTQALTGADQ